MNSANVKLPVQLLNELVCIFDGLFASDAIAGCTPDFLDDMRYVYIQLLYKQCHLELRVAYSRIASAKTESARDTARIEYLRLKNDLHRQFLPL